jgi:hypothetical protein
MRDFVGTLLEGKTTLVQGSFTARFPDLGLIRFAVLSCAYNVVVIADKYAKLQPFRLALSAGSSTFSRVSHESLQSVIDCRFNSFCLM